MSEHRPQGRHNGPEREDLLPLQVSINKFEGSWSWKIPKGAQSRLLPYSFIDLDLVSELEMEEKTIICTNCLHEL
ncbi:MAG: hypothetical protein AMK69_28100 [Nitrospira bacterium SG8_3]|nr:MAG: hypothetical protein AMK69_28100 [Nitrospira bacterium SG8_3]